MAPLLLISSLLLSSLAVFFSLVLLTVVYENCRFWKSRRKQLAPSQQTFHRTTLIIPCKGMEHRLRENLTAYLRQDHPNYEVVFVVESESDSAVPLIRNLMSENRCVKTRLLFSGRAESCGQKVHNLRFATADLTPDVEVLAFADSDIEPTATWLRWLVAGVGRPHLGARTGYRWMLPKKNSFATLLVATVNNSVATLSGRKRQAFVWGGAWAIHRAVFEALGIREAWDGVLSDDLVASRAIAKARLKIEFEPQCVGTSRVEYSTSQMCDWFRRQFLMARCYASFPLRLALTGLAFLHVSWLLALFVGVWALSQGQWIGWWLVGNAMLLYVLGTARALLRQNTAKRKFQQWRSYRKAKKFDLWGHPVASAACLLLAFLNIGGDSVKWRRVRYRLSKMGRVSVIGRKLPVGAWPVADEAPVAAAGESRPPLAVAVSATNAPAGLEDPNLRIFLGEESEAVFNDQPTSESATSAKALPLAMTGLSGDQSADELLGQAGSEPQQRSPLKSIDPVIRRAS